MDVKKLLEANILDKNITIQGWIRSLRVGKSVAFIMLNDGSTLNNLQAVISSENQKVFNEISTWKTGSSCTLEGKIVSSQGKGQKVELQVTKAILIGSVTEDYPLQKKYQTLEFLREIAHLRVRTNTIGAIARIRSELSYAIHQFFHKKNFVYVNSPILTSNDAEGAGELFRVTTLTQDQILKSQKDDDFSADFFGKSAFLAVTGQLEAESYALGLSKVYTFAPTFRSENSNTARHVAEFWMIEPEIAFCDLEDLQILSKDFLEELIQYIMKNCTEDMAFLLREDKKHFKYLENFSKDSILKLTYSEAIEELLKSKKTFEYSVEWGADLQSEHERYLTEQIFKKPLIIVDYPKEIKAFYMKQNPDGKTVSAMDILFPGIGEVIGGSQREDNYDKLLEAMQKRNMQIEQYQWYLDLRKYGSVPHSGFGLGLERFLQFITKVHNIRDVLPFPRTKNNLEF